MNSAFAVARNPWDRVVSRYFFAKKVTEVEKKEPVGKHKIDSFEHFLESRFDWGGQKLYVAPCYPWLVSYN
jgi:hypothetical protein